MSKKTRQVRAWKFLIEQVKDIQDPWLRKGMIADFRERALREWGWDPVTGNLATADAIELDEWEKQFVQDIQDTKIFGFDVREEKRAAQLAEARSNMMTYVRDGGTLMGIPDNIRTPDIEDLYWECRNYLTEELLQQADNVLPAPDIDEPEHIGTILPRVLNELKAKAEARNDKTTND